MQVTPELLQKYHLKLCSKEEQQLVEAWLLSSETADHYPASPGEDDLTLEIWKEFKADANTSFVSPAFNTGRLFRILTGLAACVAVIIGIWYGLAPGSASFKDSQPDILAMKSIRTQPGERMKFDLPDGTVVYLNAGSELRYAGQFTDTSRIAWLTGEAYFEVAKDASRPFTIHASHSETRVLGTAFNLKAYPGDSSITLVVQEGKVRFSSTDGDKNALILMANEKAVIQPARQLAKDNVYAAGYTGWKENKLVFNNQKLTEILPMLERWYGVKINIGSPELGERRCTGSFVNPTLKNLLASMGYSMNFKYTVNENDVLIY